jgi:hypothetical protein
MHRGQRMPWRFACAAIAAMLRSRISRSTTRAGVWSFQRPPGTPIKSSFNIAATVWNHEAVLDESGATIQIRLWLSAFRGLGVQQAQIGHDMLLVIAGQDTVRGRRVFNGWIEWWRLHCRRIPRDR